VSALLEVEGLTKRFSGVTAVKDVSFTLQAGEITGVLGPNGAGKTTLFNLLTGFLPSDGGAARFEGKPILGVAPHVIVNRGVARTFQLCRPFHGMTVRENVAVGCLAPRVHPGGGLERRVAEILGEVGLAHKAGRDPALRRPSAPRDRACARHPAAAAAARRALRRPRRGRDRAAGAAHPPAAR
jgi:branched-chain amino acid transport system ATP-binding protein